jgi:hypothetical protein
MNRNALACLVLIFIIACARADETWTGTADVKFHGFSTLHDFDGTVNKVPLKVTVSTGANGRMVSATSSAEVQDMSTANDKRDASMREMFQQAKYRFIKIEVPETSERTLKPGGGKSGAMPITLTIAGKQGKVSGTVTNVVEAATRCSFDLAFPVSLKAFSLEPPKAVGGLVKVKDTVDVKVRVALRKAGAK